MPSDWRTSFSVKETYFRYKVTGAEIETLSKRSPVEDLRITGKTNKRDKNSALLSLNRL